MRTSADGTYEGGQEVLAIRIDRRDLSVALWNVFRRIPAASRKKSYADDVCPFGGLVPVQFTTSVVSY